MFVPLGTVVKNQCGSASMCIQEVVMGIMNKYSSCGIVVVVVVVIVVEGVVVVVGGGATQQWYWYIQVL